MKRVAERISLYAKAGHQVVVVVSAMGDTTDELIDLADEISPNPPPREMDMLITAGERMSMAVLSMALNEVGVTARAYTGSQAGLITDNDHGKAQILRVTPGRVKERSEEHTSELQSRGHLVCRLLLEKKKKRRQKIRKIK